MYINTCGVSMDTGSIKVTKETLAEAKDVLSTASEILGGAPGDGDAPDTEVNLSRRDVVKLAFTAAGILLSGLGVALSGPLHMVGIFAFMTGTAFIGVLFVQIVDIFLAPEFSTWREIRRGNVAAAVYLLALCVLLVGGLQVGAAGFRTGYDDGGDYIPARHAPAPAPRVPGADTLAVTRPGGGDP